MRKTTRRRTPAHKVNKTQRAAAIAKLAEIVDNDSVAPYVAAKAAAALLSAEKIDRGDDPDGDPDAARTYLTIPDNQRDPGVRYGLHSPETQRTVIVPTWAGFPLELQPESHYSAIEQPIGVVASMAASKARVAAALEQRNAELTDMGFLAAPREAA
jgi:hypothetical protein